MKIETDLQRCDGLEWADVKIMAQACVFLPGEPAAGLQIRRGMILVSAEGQEAGKVAGVAVSQDGQVALCLILSHLPEESGYQSLPVRWIERVEGDAIFLNAPFDRIRTIPDWHAA